ncbi:MAG TPA: hypothetical protein VHO69_02460, partial [Phototrophicaceae bacterium]|nr:hypothetical protein [Phototrophicaceae bacterium]
MEIAREYTEYWLHQQQIRETVGQPGLTEPHFLAPLLDIFMRALPRTFREVEAEENTHVQVIISGEAGNSWSLLREAQGWSLYRGVELPVTAQVTLDADTAWRLFTKGMTPEAAAERATFAGDETLGRVMLQTVAIIA